jgi:hypothetical protein
MASEWNEAYRNALHENQGRGKLLEAVRNAEAAIEGRHRELDKLPTGHLAERLNLKTASKDLKARSEAQLTWLARRTRLIFKMSADFSEVLINVWSQALVDKSETVKLGSESYKVTQSKAKRLRQVEFVFEGKTVIRIQQNPNTKSKWAEQARAGKKVMQFIQDGTYIAVVAAGKVTRYGKKIP